eukprot:CAMPEP_0171808712 /NCGR_PEP_ID=MMETSP0991-20121206/76548_1 /TAXON_ID=483369 /ORGANISM="non described non described, Strain CCMP2098" /LENGTH=122 /DNA_ID=CAMNT_0012421685 /DNA_START=107 /DNA_END=472 /DNA_ORIENTATION=-
MSGSPRSYEALAFGRSWSKITTTAFTEYLRAMPQRSCFTTCAVYHLSFTFALTTQPISGTVPFAITDVSPNPPSSSAAAALRFMPVSLRFFGIFPLEVSSTAVSSTAGSSMQAGFARLAGDP